MNLSRSKTIWLIVVLALAVLSVRPEPFVGTVFSYVFSPVRVLNALSSPLSVFGVVRAETEPEVLESEERECRELAAAFARHAQPSDPDLRLRSVRIDAEVVRRGGESLDTIVVRLTTREGVERGAPVVCGDAFVGRIASFDSQDPRLAEVELLTGRRFRVGAVTQGAPRDAELVVGGLTPEVQDRGLHLAVHNPSDRSVRTGIVRVSEPRELLLDIAGAELADGFLLGELRSISRRSDEVLAIRPALDFEAGLFHVLVLVPHNRAPERVPELDDLFDSRAWRGAKMLLHGELSPWRAARKLSVGAQDGVEPGAALRFGARFLGRVQTSGPLFSDVRLLGDPGLSFPALARVDQGDGTSELVVLGSLACLPSSSRALLRLRWKTHAPLPTSNAFGVGAVRARLFTGSGSAGVPLGLLVGDTILPTRAGTHVLEVELAPELFRNRGLAVRVVPRGAKP